MTREEYVKTLEKEEDDNAQEAEDNGYGSGYYDGLDYAVYLAEKLDEPEKVIVPQFVADWITRAKLECDHEPIYMAEFLADSIDEGTDYHFDWLQDTKNQKLLLNAIANGYEVEKPKYGVIVKGFGVKDGYLILSSDSNCFFLGNRKIYSRSINTFTKQYLAENWPEYEAYNNAGLLEFEEVEDD